MEKGSIESSTQGGITTITFHHPQSNSLPGELLRQLAESITMAGLLADCKVIVLKSHGDKAFCAGASFDELVSIESESGGLHFFSGFAQVINAMRNCPKFIIGRVQGKAVGGGVGLAASVDYCFATKDAAIKLSELAVGIGPFVVGPAVERKMGLAAFSQLAINATQWQSAEWAQQKGLYFHLSDSEIEMDKAIDELAQTLAISSPEAMAELKKVLWHDTSHWDSLLTERAGISGRLVLSDFTRSAIARFKSKQS